MTATSSAAQDEFDQFIARNTEGGGSLPHPEDRGKGSDDDNSNSTADDDSHDDGQGANGGPRNGRGAWRRGTKKPSTRDLEDSDDEDYDEDDDAKPRDSMKAGRYFLPSRQHDANTGPKGVIADAYAFENAKRSRASFFSLPSSKKAAPAANTSSAQRREKRSSDDDDLDEDDDDEFMTQWRQSRLQELRSKEGKRKVSPTGASGKRWGTLQTVDGEGYLDAVERSGRDTIVLVLIYDDDSDVSNTVEQLVRQLARSHPSTRFVRLHREDAEMEGAGVPALLAYRNGDKFAGLVPLLDELPDHAELSAETLRVLLQRHQML